MPGTAPPAAGSRFEGLDRLRGIALGAMLLHHLLSWTGGDEQVRRFLAVSEGMNGTDLAAPAFALAVGTSASIAGRRSAGRPDALRGPARRWAVIFGWGLVISAALDGRVDALGVLEILAVVGLVLSLAIAPGDGRPHPLRWSIVAAGLAALALPSIEAAAGIGGVAEALLAGRFPVVSYLALGAAGAAAADALGHRERRGRLLLLAAAVAVVGVALHAGGAHVWPPDRTPGGLPLVVPGVVAVLAVWWAATLLRGPVGDVLERAGRRTLEVFIAHYAIRIALNAGGWTGELQGRGWAAVAIATAVAGVGAAASWDRWSERRRATGAEAAAAATAAGAEAGAEAPSPALVGR